MKRFYLFFVVVFTALSVQAATVTFNTIYFGTGSAYTINSSSIVLTLPIVGSNFKFTSANPADVTFSGNNVAGQLTYVSGNLSYAINGVISRKVGNSSNYSAFYFAETTVLGGASPTGRAYLLVVPTKSVTSNSSVNTNSAPVNSDLNDFLSVQTSNNNPPTITSNGAGQNAYISITEGTTAVTTVTSTDVLKGTQTSETATYTITGGSDASRFTLNSTTGVLVLNAAPDFENPTDAGLNNVYDVQVTVTDSQGATDVQDIAITITDLNDNTPAIISNGGGATASVAVTQGTTLVTTVAASDADYGDVLTYSIVSGGNSTLFNIDPATGNLEFKTNAVVGSYTVTVKVTDSQGHFDTQTLTVNVTATDVTRPTVVITSSDNNLYAGETCTVYFRFSELVEGFSQSDIATEGGNISGLTNIVEDPTLYTATFTQTGSSYAPKITIADNLYSDLNSNLGYGNSLTLSYDITPPTVSVSFSSSDISFGETEVVTFTFTENPGTSFTTNDITVTNATLLSLVPTGNPLIWTATIKQNSAVSAPVVTVINQSYADPAGNLGSTGTNTLPLVPPTIDLANTSASDTGASSNDNITTNRKPVLNGFVASGVPTVSVTVEYYVNVTLTTITYTNVPVTNQVYSLNLASVSPATGTMPALGLPEGYVSLLVTTPSSATASNQFLIDLTPPTNTPTANNLTTFDATPTLTGNASLADGEVLKVKVNGITYSVGDGNLTFNGSAWSLSIPYSNKLTPSSYPVEAKIVDVAGNESIGNGSLIVNASTLSIDLANTTASDTGISNTDNNTSNRKPVINGTSNGSDASVKVILVAGGVTYTYNSVAISDGNWSLDLATASPSSIIPTGIFPTDGLPSGTVQLTVEGNTSGATATNSFVIDYTNPIDPTVNSDTTNDTTPVITGTATVGAGEVLRVTINGVTYTNGDGRLSFSAGVWTLNIPAGDALSVNNAYPTTVTVTDLAGNVSSGSGTITISNATVSIDLANTSASDTGDSSTDNITTNRKPVIVGTASADAVVTVSIVSGGVTYSFNNVAVVSGVWTLNLATASTTSGAAMPALGLAEGTVSLTVTGNTSSASENSSFELNYISTTTSDGTWTTVTKWDTEVEPNSTIATAVLKHKISIPESEVIVCKDITLDAGASLTNNAELTIKDNLVLKVSNNNTSSSIINNGQVTNQGRIIIRKSFSRDFGWYFMSFPFNVPANKIFIAGTNTVARWGDPTQAATSTNDFYVSEYDGAKRDNTGVVDYVSNSPNWKDVTPHTFIAKKGYIVAVPGDIEIDFVSGVGETSIFNPNSTVDVVKYENNAYDYHKSWNLIGIPYATSYKLNLATQVPFYSYNKPQSNYDVVMTPDDEYLINPYYSFFMQATVSTVDFLSAGRLAIKSRVSNPTYSEINLVLKNKSYSDKTRIRIDEGANANYVIGTDAVKMFSDVSAVPQIYTSIGTYPVAYNTLPSTTSAVDVTTKIGVKGDYSISLTKAIKAMGYSKITLSDNVLNKQQDLLVDSVYTFNSDAGTFKRFKVLLSNASTTDVVTANEYNITAFATKNNIRINGIENQATIKVYTLTGELLNVFANVVNDMPLRVNYNGMIILKIENGTNLTVIKLNI